MVSLLYSFFVSCSLADEVADIPNVSCIQRLGQIQRVAFQRTKNGTVTNEFVIASANPNVLASWTALIAADDDTKIQMTPTIGDFTTEVGDIQEVGGGNATVDGVQNVLRVSPTTVTGKFPELPQSIISAIKAYQYEKQTSVYLFNEYGQVIGLTDSHSTPSKFKGIPIESFFVKDKNMGGFEDIDSNDFGWKFKQKWSDMLHAIKATDFNPVLDLTN
jgi:hypothetical protein